MGNNEYKGSAEICAREEHKPVEEGVGLNPSTWVRVY